MAANDAKTGDARKADDVAAIAEQMKVLRQDFNTLTELMKGAAEGRADEFGRRLAAGLEENKRAAQLRAESAQLRTEAAIVANPLMAVGVALGLGLLIGAFTKR